MSNDPKIVMVVYNRTLLALFPEVAEALGLQDGQVINYEMYLRALDLNARAHLALIEAQSKE